MLISTRGSAWPVSATFVAAQESVPSVMAGTNAAHVASGTELQAYFAAAMPEGAKTARAGVTSNACREMNIVLC